MRPIFYIVLAFITVSLSCQHEQTNSISDFTSTGVTDSLIEFNPTRALAILDSINPRESGLFYLNKGKAHLRLQKAIEAQNEFEKALKKSEGDSALYADAHYYLSHTNHMAGHYQQAQEHLVQCLAYSKLSDIKKGKCYIMLGINSKDRLDYTSSLFYYGKALSQFAHLKDSNNMALCYHNIGSLYLNLNLDSALQYTTKAIQWRSKLGQTKAMLSSMTNLGEIYNAQGKFNDVIVLEEKIIRENMNGHDIRTLMYSYLTITEAYLSLHKHKESEYYALKALKIAQSIPDYAIQVRIFKGLMKEALHEKNIQKSRIYYKQLDSLSIVLNQAEAEDIKTEIEQRLNDVLKLKEAELNTLKLKDTITQKKILQWQFFAFVLLSLGAIYILFRLYQNYRSKLEDEKLENRLLQTDLSKSRQSEKEAVEKLIHLGQGIIENKDIFDEILSEIEKNKGVDTIDTSKVGRLIKNRNHKIDDREIFMHHLHQVQDGFFKQLKLKYPDLTQTEIKVCGLLTLNLSSKEMATLLNVEPKSVDMYRYRLRKKLHLPEDGNLSDFLKTI